MRKFYKPILLLGLALGVVMTLSMPAAAPSRNLDLPMQVVGSIPAVEVMVNGKGPFLFAIDTGAQGMARVDSSLIEKLALQPAGEMRGTDPSGRGPQMMPIVRLESIEIGGMRFADVEAAARNYKSSPRTSKIDGILTLNFFARSLVTLDFPGKRVRIHAGELPPADGAEILEYQSEGGIPVLQLRAGDVSITAHIDTGNAIGGFVLPAALAQKLSFDSEPATVARARSISGEVEIKEGRCKEIFRLGSYEFAQPVVTFPALGEFANIGAKALGDFTVTFDARNTRLRLARVDGARPQP